MSRYNATVEWTRDGAAFTDNRYSRAHAWAFDGGAVVPASASPQIVPLPLSRAENVDPEEAFVASVSSCHMLWFLSTAAKSGFRVDRYRDEAEGLMEKDARGRLAITRVTLRPHATFSGPRVPTKGDLDALHHDAHEACFIANSIRSEVVVDAAFAVAG